MNRILGRLFFFLLTISWMLCWKNDSQMIFVILVGVIYVSLSIYFLDSKVHPVITALMGILMLVADMYVPLLPMLVYDAFFLLFFGKKKECIVTGAVVFLYLLLFFAGQDKELIRIIMKDYRAGFFFLVLCASSIYASYLEYGFEKNQRENRKMRDDNEEFRLLMTEKNQLVLSRQDDEITMATLKERNRIAREIHDNVGHLLSRSILQIGALMSIYKEEPLADSLKQVNATLNESMNNIRNSVHDLHNESLDLDGALKDIIQKHDEYETEYEYDMVKDTDRRIKYCIISIVSEGYENIRKHSDATKVWLSVREHPEFFQLIIKDNGSKVKKVQESGIGLHNIENRVSELGGNVNFSIDDGFRIFVTLPKIRESI